MAMTREGRLVSGRRGHLLLDMGEKKELRTLSYEVNRWDSLLNNLVGGFCARLVPWENEAREKPGKKRGSTKRLKKKLNRAKLDGPPLGAGGEKRSETLDITKTG